MKTILFPAHVNYLFILPKNLALLLVAAVLFGMQPARAATIESAQTGPWLTPATWVGGAVPGTGDDAVIKTGHTVTLTGSLLAPATITIDAGGQLDIDNPTVTGAGPTYVNDGTVHWIAGELKTISFTNNGTINIDNGPIHQLFGAITNHGAVNFTDGVVSDNSGTSTFTNSPTGTLLLNGDGWGVDILNNGAISKTVGSSGGLAGIDYSGSGSITVATGVALILSDGFIGTFDGEITVNGQLTMTGATYGITIGTSANIHGTGEVILGGGGIIFDGEPLELDVANVALSTQLSGSSVIKIQAGTQWNWHAGGEFACTNPVENYGTVNMFGASPEHYMAVDFENYGTFNWQDGDLEYTGGVDHFINKSGGLLYFDAQTGGWQVPITNEGDFFCHASPVMLPVELVNEVGSTFTIAAGGELVVANTASITQHGASTVDGILEFQGGVHQFNQADDMSGTGEIKFTNDLTTINAPNGWQPAISTVTQDANIDGTAELTILSGTTWNWGNGTLNLPSPITNNGVFHLHSTSNHNTESNILNNGVLTIDNGHIDGGANGHFLTNTVNGIINFQSNSGTGSLDCYMSILNSGMVNIVGTVGTSFWGDIFENLTGGTLFVDGSCDFKLYTAMTQSGTVDIVGRLTLEGATVTLNTVAGFDGTGELKITNVTTINSSLGWSPAVAKVQQNSGVTGTAVVTIPSGKTWEWHEGDFDLEGPLTVNGTLDILTATDHFSTCDIENNGVVNWKEGTLKDYNGNEIILFNNVGGLFTTDQNLGLVPCAWEIYNYGTMEMNNDTRTDFNAYLNVLGGTIGGTGIGEVRTYDGFIWNGGEISIKMKTEGSADLYGNLEVNGGSILFNNSTYFHNDLNLTLSNGGEIGANGVDLEPLMGDPKQDAKPVANARMVGGIFIESGAHILAGTNAGAFSNNGSITKTGSGTATIDVRFENQNSTQIEAGTLDLNGNYALNGNFKGAGTLNLTDATVDLPVSGGYLPGNSPGILNVTGNATLNILQIEIEEGPPVLFDQLIVSGTANLGGNLTILETGNVPVGSWAIITAAAISGTFTSVDQPGCFEIEYTATSVILKKIGKLKTWTGGTGVWSDDNGWTPFGVPCPLDTVVIPAGEVTLDIQPQMAILTVSGGQLLNNVINASIDAPLIVTTGAELDVALGFTIDINGSFCNSGKITGNGIVDIEDATIAANCYGEWSPGNSAGKLRAKGTHTNDIVSIEIGGNGGTVEVDLLEVTESMITEGELRLNYLGGTVPVGTRTIMECIPIGTACRSNTEFDNIIYNLPQGSTGINIIYEPERIRIQNTIPIQFSGFVNWLGGAGNWTDQAKWSSNDVPNDDDDVIIESGVVELTATATAKTLALSGGQIFGTSSLIVNDDFDWSGGQISTFADVHVGPMTLSGSPILTNGSLILDENGTLEQGSLTLGTNANLTVATGATLTINNPLAANILKTGTGNSFTNLGTLDKLGAGTFSIDVPFSSNGLTNIQAGTLKFGSSFTNTNGILKGIGTMDITNQTMLQSGFFQPGSSPGTLFFSGNFLNNANSQFDFEMMENSGVVTKDLLEITGSAVLGGTLNVRFLGGNIPNGTYPIVTTTGATTGTFSTINYLPACPGLCAITYSATGANFVLTAALPVEMTRFNGFFKNNSVELAWATATETNSEGFEIQRSADGAFWDKIGFVAGHGASTEPHDYFFIDKSPHVGANYYRLKIVGLDGGAEFSEIIAIHSGSDKDADWAVYPNPANDELTVLFSEKREGSLWLFDWSGRQVLVQDFLGEKIEIDLSRLPSGAYFLKMQDGKGRAFVKL